MEQVVHAAAPSLAKNWLSAIEQTVGGLGYELVDCERGAAGLLRVFIDRLPGQSYLTGPGESVTVDDCEVVTRQLQYALEVVGCDYSRLEVSSPGLDRPLKKPEDYVRFSGLDIELTLKQLFQGRKKYRGTLRAEDQPWQLIFNDGKQDQVLEFAFDEVREAHLVPVIDFKGRTARSAKKQGVEGRKE